MKTTKSIWGLGNQHQQAIARLVPLREWRCCNGHVLGLIISNGRYNILALVDPRLEHPVPFATISGGAIVMCLVCEDERVWHFGDDFKEYLLEKS